MKTKKYNYLSIVFLGCILLSSCEDYLDKVQEFEGLQKKDVFSDVRLAKNFLDGAYTHVLSEVSSYTGNTDILSGMVMSDEGYPGIIVYQVPETYDLYAQGDYLSLMNRPPGRDIHTPYFVDRYFEGWQGVRTVNSLLANVDNINNATQEEINNLKGQAYFLRAFYFHLMTKRVGGLIYFKENLELNESLDRERESYESNLADMIEDLDKAINLLPIYWESINVGRPTKGAALALKSRVTLFAASPLVNTNSNQAAWTSAAQAAGDLINFANDNGLYGLVDASSANSMDVGPDGADLFESEPEKLRPYRNIFVGPGVSKAYPQEVIFMEPNLNIDKNATVNPVPRLTLTVGFDIIKNNCLAQGIGATANFVAKFETKNGLAIEDDPSYDPQNPFVNRDPRFYNDILFDGVPWVATIGAENNSGKADLAVVNEEGDIGLDLQDPRKPKSESRHVKNLTGYRIRKWIPNGLYWQNGQSGNWDFHVNNIMFRMSEIYLNYAEAVNEAFGPNGAAPGVSLTALEAVNIIRNRVGMPNVNSIYSGSKELLRERIRNERAIELCFEGIRYDDLRRWKLAELDEYTKVEFLEMRWQGGPSVTYPTGFSFDNVEQSNLKKTFNDRNYWWPIPSAEVEAATSFRQTDGW